MINVEKLTDELIKAGIKISGCNSAGVVWAEDGHTEIQKLKEVSVIIGAHNPAPVIVQSDIDALKARIDILEAKTKDIPAESGIKQ